jgi:mannose-1-phosphate guanylyltransferase
MTTDARPLPAAMVLAAGLGTRLRPLTDELPKPLAWLGDRPLIDAILASLARAGFIRAVANTHHLASAYDGAWRGRQPLEVALVHEPSILGTGGGLANAASLLGPGDVLVWNADIWAELDVPALLEAHALGASVATLVTGPRRGPKLGTLGLDASGRVARVRAFDRGGEVESADYAGIAVLGEPLRARLPAPGCLVGDGLIPALEDGDAVATFALPSAFHDLGTLELYLEANLAWLSKRRLDAYVAPTAEVAPGVTLRRAIVASSARVVGAGALSDVVVWPGATATAPLSRAVVTPRGIVRARCP